jgi:hypothetical protein
MPDVEAGELSAPMVKKNGVKMAAAGDDDGKTGKGSRNPKRCKKHFLMKIR